MVLGSETGKFSGEEKLLGESGKSGSASGEPGKCFFDIGFDPYECRYVRFLLHKEFGSSSTGTDWLFVKEAEVWKAAE